MSLRKSPILAPARIEASRRNSKKSTGPRTARGKGQSRMNGLRTGGRSALHENFFLLMLDAPPCSVNQVARALLTPEMAAHPLFRDTVDMFRRAEGEVVGQCVLRPEWHRLKSKKKPPEICERSLNVAENKASCFLPFHYVIENRGWQTFFHYVYEKK